MRHNRPCLCLRQEPRHEAIHRCCQARNRALADCKGLQISDYQSGQLGAEAYLASLPAINTTADIKDYAACLQHAVAISVIDPAHAPALLATARMVLNAIRADLTALEIETRLAQSDAKIELSKARELRHRAKLGLKEQSQTAV